MQISEILSELSGAVRWGGTFTSGWESYFQIDVPLGDPLLDSLAARMRQWRDHLNRAGAPAKWS
jgi:hypothetical protein